MSSASRCIVPIFMVVCLLLVAIPSKSIAQDGSDILIQSLEVRTVIDHSYAVTDIKEVLHNPTNKAKDETFIMEIPEDAFLSNFSIEMDGRVHYADIIPKKEADQKYEQAKRKGTTAVNVQSRGRSTFAYLVNIGPEETITIGLVYEEFLKRRPEGFRYSYSLVSDPYERTIESFDIEVTIRAADPILWVKTFNYNRTRVGFTSLTEADVTYGETYLQPERNFILLYDIGPPPVNGRMLNYLDDDSGYFFHVFSPGVEGTGGYLPKDIVFVIDVSGSMNGEKIAQVKDAFSSIMDKLMPEDRFSIVTFSSFVDIQTLSLITANGKNKDDAKKAINMMTTGGSTNINEALIDGLAILTAQAEKLSLIVFLTDGQPTSGVSNKASIRANVRASNTKDTGIYCLGFGEDVDFEFLDALSKENKGSATRIFIGKDASDQILDFYSIISIPLLKDIGFSYTPEVHDVVPENTPFLFEGSEIAIAGRIEKEALTIGSEVTATRVGEEVRYNELFELDPQSTSSFIPRFWAYATIRALLDEIIINGEDEQIKERIIGLATEYGFVTPYTSFYVEVGAQQDAMTSQPIPLGGMKVQCGGFAGPAYQPPRVDILENETTYLNDQGQTGPEPVAKWVNDPLQDLVQTLATLGTLLIIESGIATLLLWGRRPRKAKKNGN